jgi:hypothetical protein
MAQEGCVSGWVWCGLCPYEYRLRVIVLFGRGLYIRRAQKPSGPNLLDETLKNLIVYPARSPW